HAFPTRRASDLEAAGRLVSRVARAGPRVRILNARGLGFMIEYSCNTLISKCLDLWVRHSGQTTPSIDERESAARPDMGAETFMGDAPAGVSAGRGFEHLLGFAQEDAGVHPVKPQIGARPGLEGLVFPGPDGFSGVGDELAGFFHFPPTDG